MCWAESWEQRRLSEYLLSESRVKNEWKKTRTPLPRVLPAWEVKLTSFFPPSDFVLKSAQFCGCIKYKDNHLKKICFILSTFVVLAFPWTINKSKDCSGVSAFSSASRCGQAGSSAAPAVLLCQGEGGAGSQGISRWFSHGLGLSQYHGAFFLFSGWSLTVSGLVFKCLICFELIAVWGVR